MVRSESAVDTLFPPSRTPLVRELAEAAARRAPNACDGGMDTARVTMSERIRSNLLPIDGLLETEGSCR